MEIFKVLIFWTVVVTLGYALFAATAHANGNGNGPPPFNMPEVNASQTAVVNAEQKNSVYLGGAGAPGMSASSYDCNIISKSWSVLIFAYGKSKCEPGSIVWRDVNWLVYHKDVLGLSDDELATAVKRRVCSDKKMRKVVGNCPAKVRVVREQREMH